MAYILDGYAFNIIHALDRSFQSSTLFHVYLGDKRYILNAATAEEKDSFVQELYIVS